MYNPTDITGSDKVFLQGYDWAVKHIDSLFDDMRDFPELERLMDDRAAVIMSGKAEVTRACIMEWAEMERDELVASMIDAEGNE